MNFYRFLNCLFCLFIFAQVVGAAVRFTETPAIKIQPTDETITIDGYLSESVWQESAATMLKYETEPGENVTPEVRTRAIFTYDPVNLYLGFICHESDISELRAQVTERDNIFEDDQVGIILDTFNDQQNAYQFFINPHGIQMDGIYQEDLSDYTYDLIWYSATQIREDYWMAEIKIPFKSLKFPQREIQNWRLHIQRRRPRSSKQRISWMPENRHNPALLEQTGWLRGLQGIEDGTFLHFLPYIIGAQKSELTDPDVPSSDYLQHSADFDAGGSLKYGLSSNLTLDLVYNPDFSQVESDAAQIDVNSTMALYFDEKRPFFQEGNEIFRSHRGRDLIYTRTINNPLLAGKLSGKIGNMKLGYISAWDQNSPYVISLEDRSRTLASNHKSVSNILRLKYDLGEQSYLGAILTDREADNHGFNRIGGMDARFVVNTNYYFTFLLVGSQTREPNDTTLFADSTTFSNSNKTASFDGETFQGLSFYSMFRRKARNLNFFVRYYDYSPGFRASNGLVQANNLRNYEINFDFTFYPNNALVDFGNFSPEMSQEYNHQNQLKIHRYSTTLLLEMKKQTQFWFSYTHQHNRFQNILFKDLYEYIFEISASPVNYLSVELSKEFGRDIFRTTEIPRKAFADQYNLELTLRLNSRLSLSSSFSHYQLDEINRSEQIFHGYTTRMSFRYHHNQNLHLRIITQYNSFTENYQFDPLLKYQLNPFTIFYIGSTQEMRNFPQPYGFEPLERQYFMKLQYLFQV